MNKNKVPKMIRLTLNLHGYKLMYYQSASCNSTKISKVLSGAVKHISIINIKVNISQMHTQQKVKEISLKGRFN